jgi:hypothetical protein
MTQAGHFVNTAVRFLGRMRPDVTLVLQLNAPDPDSVGARQRRAPPIRAMPDRLDGKTSIDPGPHDRTPARRDAKLRNFALTRTARST